MESKFHIVLFLISLSLSLPSLSICPFLFFYLSTRLALLLKLERSRH